MDLGSISKAHLIPKTTLCKIHERSVAIYASGKWTLKKTEGALDLLGGRILRSTLGVCGINCSGEEDRISKYVRVNYTIQFWLNMLKSTD
jgi:hypothetical protein